MPNEKRKRPLVTGEDICGGGKGDKCRNKLSNHCKICNRRCSSKSALTAHMVITHRRKSNYFCRICDEYWPFKVCYSQHVKTHAAEHKLYRCSECGRVYKTFSKFKVHSALHSTRHIVGFCKECFKPFGHIKLLTMHECTDKAPSDPVSTKDGVNAAQSIITYDILAANDNSLETSGSATTSLLQVKCIRMKTKLLAEEGKGVSVGLKKRCKKCNKTFLYAGNLTKHMKVSQSCGELMTHINTKCDICGQLCPSKSRLKTHMVVHTGEKNFQCNVCNERFLYKTYLHDHIRKSYRCKDAMDLPPTQIKAEHLSKVCDVCGKTDFTSNTAYRRHVKTHPGYTSPTWPSKCKVCGQKNFPSYEDYEAHRKSHLVNICDGCGMTLQGPANLQRHKRLSCASGKVCQHCNKMNFKNLGEYRNHMHKHDPTYKERHPVEEDPGPGQVHRCEKCGCQYDQMKLLRFHHRHLCIADCVCTVCKRDDFPEKRQFITHLLTHDPEYPLSQYGFSVKHMCTQCNATFDTNEQLLGHAASSCWEVGPNPPGLYPCKECDAVFPNSKKRGDHKRLRHQDHKKIECEYCKKLIAKCHYREHSYIHTGEKPYICKNCGKQFKTGTGLRYHNTKQKGPCNLTIVKI